MCVRVFVCVCVCVCVCECVCLCLCMCMCEFVSGAVCACVRACEYLNVVRCLLSDLNTYVYVWEGVCVAKQRIWMTRMHASVCVYV